MMGTVSGTRRDVVTKILAILSLTPLASSSGMEDLEDLVETEGNNFTLLCNSTNMLETEYGNFTPLCNSTNDNAGFLGGFSKSPPSNPVTNYDV